MLLFRILEQFLLKIYETSPYSAKDIVIFINYLVSVLSFFRNAKWKTSGSYLSAFNHESEGLTKRKEAWESLKYNTKPDMPYYAYSLT